MPGSKRNINGYTEGIISGNKCKKLKPIAYKECNQRFPDFILCDAHITNVHKKTKDVNNNMNVFKLTIPQLHECLKSRNLSTTRNKELLKKRLEGSLAFDSSFRTTVNTNLLLLYNVFLKWLYVWQFYRFVYSVSFYFLRSKIAFSEGHKDVSTLI